MIIDRLIFYMFLRFPLKILHETHQFPDSECPSSQECSQKDATAQGQGLIDMEIAGTIHWT
jgi:hypothetical protein